MCVELLVDFIEDVESLAGLPDIIKVPVLGRCWTWPWSTFVSFAIACCRRHLHRIIGVITGARCPQITSEWLLTHVVQVRLAKAVCTKRKLDPTAAALFAEGAPGEVVLPECTQLAETDMAGLMRGCSTPM